jgi:hypothetical protein
MQVRQIRIMTCMQAGLSYDEIAAQEQITRERLRLIVDKALKDRDESLIVDRGLLGGVELAPAPRLAAKAIIEGKLKGAERFLKVDDWLEKLRKPKQGRDYDKNIRAKLSRGGVKIEFEASKITSNSPGIPASP